MDFKIRHFKKDDNASGVFFILIPFIITIILSAVFIPMGDSLQVGVNIVVTPQGYEDMTTLERTLYLYDQFGGNPVYNYHWRLSLSWPDWAGDWYYDFPDGTSMNKEDYENFLSGEYSVDDADLKDVIMSVLTINPPVLDYLGIYGTLIRLILIVSVVIGIIEIIWIG